jgi:hypothetical protein
MVRQLRTMYEVTRTGPAVLGSWFAAWFVALAFLAAMPGTGQSSQTDNSVGVYYTFNSSGMRYQDPSGAYTVPIRTLRPVMEN